MRDGLTVNEIKRLGLLQNSQERREQGTYLIEGPHLLMEAFATNQRIFLVIMSDEHPLDLDLQTRLTDKGIKVVTVSLSQLKKISGLQNPVGPLAEVALFTADDWVGGPVIYCDRIQDPGNLGTIIRTAAATQTAVALGPGCADLFNLKTLRGTQGALWRTPVFAVPSEAEFFASAALNKYQIFGLVPREGEKLFTIQFPKRSVIIIGNEGAGISPALIEKTQKVTIPLWSGVESLNAATAAALVLYEMKRKNDA